MAMSPGFCPPSLTFFHHNLHSPGQIRAGKVSSQLKVTSFLLYCPPSPALPSGHLEMWGRGCQCLDTVVEFSL